MGKTLNILNKNRVYSISILVLLLISSSFLDTSLSLENEQSNQEKTLTFNIDFEQPKFNNIFLNGQRYTKVSLKNCLLFSEPGDPSLPIYPVKILLPPNCEITKIEVIYKLKKEIDYDVKDKPIMPQQEPVKIGFNEKNNFKINDNAYRSSKPVKNRLYSSTKISSCRGYDILSLSLHPVNYIPGKSKIFYYPQLKIIISYKKVNKTNIFFRNSFDDEQWVKTLVINPEQTESYSNLDIPLFEYTGGLCNKSEDYDYVIITTTHNNLDNWTTNTTLPYNWTSLMTKHTVDDGFNCTIVTVQDILNCSDYWNDTALFNDTPAKIREFCKDAYLDWNTNYILIGGDDEWIPAREMDYAYESDVDSDIYWSHLDNTFNNDQDDRWGEEGDSGFDLYAELFIGRIPCDEPQDVSNWLNKSFYYSDSEDIGYLDNAGFYGGDTGWDTEGDDFLEFSAITGTSNWTGPNPGNHGEYPNWLGFLWGFETWNENHLDMPFNLSVKWTADNPNLGWQGGNTSSAIEGFKNAINSNQVTLISGIAHANEDMSLDVVSADWESNYHNTRPFLIYDYGCHCGDIDAADDGILHSMLFHSDVELAFACIYNTCYGWGSFSDTNSSSALLQKLFWDYLFDLQNNSGSLNNWTLGKAMAYSKDAMAPTINWTYAGAPGSWRAVIQGCLLFGDPAQKIRAPYVSLNDGIINLTNEHPLNQSINLDVGNRTLSIDITDPDGDLMNITFSTNASGNWSIIGSNNSQQNGTFTQIYQFNNYSTTYYWRITVIDLTGNSDSVNETYFFTTRAIHNVKKPEGFNSTTINSTSINLSWIKGENATHTYIERNTTFNWTIGNGFKVYNGTGTYFIDNNLSEDTQYYYQAWSWDSVDGIWNLTSASTYNSTDTNNAPSLNNESPANESLNLSINLTELTINITDIDGNNLSWSIETSPDIGNCSGYNETSGVKNCSVSNLNYSTNYTWFVNVTDGTNWIKKWYIFTTESNLISHNNCSEISNPSISNNSKDISVNTKFLSIYISDPEGDTFNWTVETKPDIGSCSGNNETNGTKICNITGLEYSTTYYWFVNVTDSGNGTWINHTYLFKTENRPSGSNSPSSPHRSTMSNNAPNKPDRPFGVEEGYVETSYSYTSKTTDPNNNKIKYQFNWGDGNKSEWSDYLDSGEDITMSHIWYEYGEYEISVIAKDTAGKESDWSESFIVKIYEVLIFEEDIEVEVDISDNKSTDEDIIFNLSVSCIDDKNLEYYWDFGDGNFSSEKQPDHKYSQPGTYVVSLIIYDKDGKLVANTTYELTIVESSSSNIDGVNGTKNQEQKINYIMLLVLFFSLLVLVLLLIFTKVRTTDLNYNNFGFSYNKKRDFGYNYDLNTRDLKTTDFDVGPNNKGYPQKHDIKLREQIDDLLSKFYKGK